MKSIVNIHATDNLGRELAARFDLSLRDRLAGFVSLVRPFFFILTPVNAAAAAVLALGRYPAPAKCVLGFLAVAFASCAVNVFNDYLDRERDRDSGQGPLCKW